MTAVVYEIDGWGVGELWLDGRRVHWHELPRPVGTDHPYSGGASDGDDFASLGISDNANLVETLLKRLVQHYGIE